MWGNGGKLRAKGAALSSVGCEDWTAHLHCFLERHKGELFLVSKNNFNSFIFVKLQ